MASAVHVVRNLPNGLCGLTVDIMYMYDVTSTLWSRVIIIIVYIFKYNF